MRKPAWLRGSGRSRHPRGRLLRCAAAGLVVARLLVGEETLLVQDVRVEGATPRVEEVRRGMPTEVVVVPLMPRAAVSDALGRATALLGRHPTASCRREDAGQRKDTAQ